MDQVMVVQAQEREVLNVGPPVGLPGHHMVRVGERHVGAAGETAMAVPAHHLSALGVSGLSPRPTLVHRVPDVVIDADRDGGITGDPPHGRGVDQSIAFELAEE